MNLFHYLSSTAQRYPQKEALIFQDRRISYRQLCLRVCTLASTLYDMGVRKGSTVGLICRNSDAYVEIFFAAAKLGAVSEHFNWRLHPRNMMQQAEASDAEIIFISSRDMNHYHALKQQLKRKAVLVIVGDSDQEALHYSSLFSDGHAPAPAAICEPGDPGVILYTSGTTGTGKAVVHSVSGFLIHTLVVIAALRWKPETVLLNVQPMFHAAATGIYSTLFAGGTVVIEDKFDDEYLRLIEKERVTRIGLVPHMIEWLTQTPDLQTYDLRSLEEIIYSGAPMSPDMLTRAERILDCGFIQIYGMTELGPNVAVLTPEEHRSFLAQGLESGLPVGKPILGMQMRIFDGKRDCAPGEIGEILVSSDTLMKGYRGLEDLTKACMKEGWFHTGDNGYLDADGFLHLAGRKKQMIICGGENIYPQEVENVIFGMGDCVRDAVVLGVPNKKWGEVVKALILRAEGSDLTEHDVLAHCQQNLSPYKKPRIIQFVEDIPRNDSGKVDREKIKVLYQNEDGFADLKFINGIRTKECKT